jgi:hypothetical protein
MIYHTAKVYDYAKAEGLGIEHNLDIGTWGLNAKWLIINRK